MDKYSITGLLLLLTATGLLVGRYMSAKRSVAPIERSGQYMNKEIAFEHLKPCLNALAAPGNKKSTYDLSFLKNLEKWDEPVKGRFQPVAPQLLDGVEILRSCSKTGVTEIKSSKPGILKDYKYWVFSWLQPGVIDESYTFYVNAAGGEVSLIVYYQSPD